MKQPLAYELDIQLFAEDNPTDEVEKTDEETKPTIDLDKFAKDKEEKTELSELEQLKAENARLAKEKLEAEEKAKKSKAAFDTAARERKEATVELRKQKEASNEPLEKLQEYEQKLAEYELNNKKNELLYGFTEDLGIHKDQSALLVDAIYHPDTNEVSVEDLSRSFREIIEDVRKQSYDKGYETRDTEMASGMRRSVHANKETTAHDKVLEDYKRRFQK